jgi:hypothetical protein
VTKSLGPPLCKLSAEGLIVLHPHHELVRFLRLHETISPSMALVDPYLFGSQRVILVFAFIAVGRSHNICWHDLAHR